jgi:hypothetical protein
VSPCIFNATLALAATEYSLSLPADAVEWSLRARDHATLQYAYVAGDSGTTFFTIPKDCTWTEENVNNAGITLYIQSNVPNTVVELEAWTS